MNAESDTPEPRTRGQQLEDHLKMIQQGFEAAHAEARKQGYRKIYDELAAEQHRTTQPQ